MSTVMEQKLVLIHANRFISPRRPRMTLQANTPPFPSFNSRSSQIYAVILPERNKIMDSLIFRDWNTRVRNRSESAQTRRCATASSLEEWGNKSLLRSCCGHALTTTPARLHAFRAVLGSLRLSFTVQGKRNALHPNRIREITQHFIPNWQERIVSSFLVEKPWHSRLIF